MQEQVQLSSHSKESTLATNKVLRNTYALLSMTLIFSAVMATMAISSNAAPVNFIVQLVVLFGTLYALNKLKNSVWSIPLVFFFTGFLGYSTGPIVNFYLGMANGGDIVATALSMTGITFLGLSAYAVSSRKDFSFMGGFLMIGLILVIVASLANIFFAIPALSLAISAVGVLVFSGFILYDTSRMVNGGETNYVMMTVSLYLNILNLFLMLLHLTGALSGDD
ncbi:Bax inhibitor-1/YccA family protein [Candidatus Njordibacter sp. Uisw_056]|jgi:modulator of FtsH protease|uniref:Bax inhibitor-1/YccA family protein n=1 Tax=Candidatus Njordibacter sp. Uisw_056 TaxID=3230973 RepID=UPI003D422AD2|tara:strand:- start:4976 stop:5644 length:669 start_codon:yes stop_codon:yes gene_type:complete